MRKDYSHQEETSAHEGQRGEMRGNQGRRGVTRGEGQRGVMRVKNGGGGGGGGTRANDQTVTTKGEYG